MPIKVTCPNGHKLNAPDNLAGRTVQCPKCKASVLIQAEVIEVVEVLEPLEAFAFDAPQADYADPFADPFAAAPLPTASTAGAMQSYGMPSQVISAPTSAKKDSTPSSSNSKLWQTRFLVGGAGVFGGLLVGSLVAFLFWPGGASSGAPKLIESQALRDALLARTKQFAKERNELDS